MAFRLTLLLSMLTIDSPAFASTPSVQPDACGPDRSSTQTRELRCNRYLDCTFPTATCEAKPAPLTAVMRTTVTRVDGCKTYLSVGTPCPTCPSCRVPLESVTYGLGGPGCERC
ncbi:hypothetical protein QBC34DRAFT_416025 [Podospora aff. communis PSN243]|uniref:Uncharacterized protein n=1 Tax=Podospora aff. communis PSN243 TaxID=3040156 RepID=A0AAV9G9D6_9PEZI|nr:hypothetical protein QBC34DRAFT_416025 [Podospora aff. communis PSN243]